MALPPRRLPLPMHPIPPRRGCRGPHLVHPLRARRAVALPEGDPLPPHKKRRGSCGRTGYVFAVLFPQNWYARRKIFFSSRTFGQTARTLAIGWSRKREYFEVRIEGEYGAKISVFSTFCSFSSKKVTRRRGLSKCLVKNGYKKPTSCFTKDVGPFGRPQSAPTCTVFDRGSGTEL